MERREETTGGRVEKRAYPSPGGTSISSPIATSPSVAPSYKGGRLSGCRVAAGGGAEAGAVKGAGGQRIAGGDRGCRAMVPYRARPRPSSMLASADSPGRTTPALLALPPPPLPFPSYGAEGDWCGSEAGRPSRSAAARGPEIPAEVFPLIFQFMDAQTLCNASSVCRAWNQQGNDDGYWRRLCRSRFNVVPDAFAPPPDPIKRLYQLQYDSLRALRKGCQNTYHSMPPPMTAHTSAQILLGLMANAM